MNSQFSQTTSESFLSHLGLLYKLQCVIMSCQNMCSDIVSKHMCPDIYSPINRIIHGSLGI